MGRGRAVFDDSERYEHDGFYEEDTDYEDEYETDDSDYIVDDEEDENPFGTMRKKLLTIFPKRSGRTKLFLLTMIRIPKKPNYPNKPMYQIAKEEQLIEELEADAEEHPFEDGTDEEERSVRSSNENCGQKPLHDWRIPPEHSGSLKM